MPRYEVDGARGFRRLQELQKSCGKSYDFSRKRLLRDGELIRTTSHGKEKRQLFILLADALIYAESNRFTRGMTVRFEAKFEHCSIRQGRGLVAALSFIIETDNKVVECAALPGAPSEESAQAWLQDIVLAMKAWHELGESGRMLLQSVLHDSDSGQQGSQREVDQSQFDWDEVF